MGQARAGTYETSVSTPENRGNRDMVYDNLDRLTRMTAPKMLGGSGAVYCEVDMLALGEAEDSMDGQPNASLKRLVLLPLIGISWLGMLLAPCLPVYVYLAYGFAAQPLRNRLGQQIGVVSYPVFAALLALFVFLVCFVCMKLAMREWKRDA